MDSACDFDADVEELYLLPDVNGLERRTGECWQFIQ